MDELMNFLTKEYKASVERCLKKQEETIKVLRGK